VNVEDEKKAVKPLHKVLDWHLGDRSKAWLAREIGKSPQLVGGVINGRHDLGRETRAAIVTAFGLEGDDALQLMMAPFGGGK
jgi:cyanate lyase